MKTYKSAAYPHKLATQFIKNNLISAIVVRHLETSSYKIYVYRSQKRVLVQSGRLNQLDSCIEEVSNKYIDAAVMEFVIEKGNLVLPEKIS